MSVTFAPFEALTAVLAASDVRSKKFWSAMDCSVPSTTRASADVAAKAPVEMTAATAAARMVFVPKPGMAAAMVLFCISL